MAGGLKTALGLWLRNLEAQNCLLVRDYVIREMNASLETHFYPRNKRDYLMVVTGIDETKEGLQQRARKIADLIRRFNLREGLKPEDDRLPKVFHRKLEDSGLIMTEEELETMLQDYYRLHGWNKNGHPDG